LLIDRLAASIIDESLPLKDVEKELRGSVAEVAVKKRGLGKREIANRCGVTEKSIDNYLKESRSNPKSPEREISRLLQDEVLSLEEIYEGVRPILCHGRHFTLDDAKRIVEKLIRTGDVMELSGKRYQGSQRPSITNPLTVEAYRDLVDEKARDLDYIILTQKEVAPEDLQPKGSKKFSRVVKDTNLVRIDFTVDVPDDEIQDFYEKISGEIAKLTLKYEKKKGNSRIRLIFGLRSVLILIAAVLGFFSAPESLRAQGIPSDENGRAGTFDSWELDTRHPSSLTPEWYRSRRVDPNRDEDDPVDFNDPNDGGAQDRLKYPAVFLRGDANVDRELDLGDMVAIINFLIHGCELACEDAADFNDDGRINITDPVNLARYLFIDNSNPQRIPVEIGPDLTPDGLFCEVSLEQ